MKKYKLIKEYPGSFKLGTIIYQEEGHWYININEDKCKFTYVEGELNFTKYPEFWEEVTKDYEILSFRHKKEFFDGTNGIYIKSGTNKFWMNHVSFKHIHYSTEEMLLNENVEIHSVKRLSDGEIFTVGDKIAFKGFAVVNSTLTKITIRPYTPFDLRLWATYTKDFASAYSIDRLSHVKKPLFTTEDGVDIFEGDKYWYVYFRGNQPLFKLLDFVAKPTPGFYSDNCKFFSTKEKAEEYILFNKPCLSLNDTYQFKNRYAKTSHIYSAVKTIAQSKIKF